MTLTIIGGVYLTNGYFRAFHWQIHGGSMAFISFWFIEDPASFLINLTGFVGSPNKGLVVFAPVCLLALSPCHEHGPRIGALPCLRS